MTVHPIIELKDVVPDCHFTFKHPINLSLNRGENWIVYGNNGSGKTCLTNTMRSAFKLKAGRINYHFDNPNSQRASDNISYVTFLDQYTGSVNTGATAYQMRWNQGSIDELFEPRVKDHLKKLDTLPKKYQATLLGTLGLAKMMDRTIISLSSGEFRRFQLLQVFATNPTLLIIDNPFIGLDAQGRHIVSELLNDSTNLLGTTLILVTSRLPQSLDGFSHIIELQDQQITKKATTSYLAKATPVAQEKVKLPQAKQESHSDIIIKANSLTIRYGTRTIIRDLSFVVHAGDCWAIQGENGCGKSTLLSIICADNPQGYACDITLFGRKRGTGESIWDIKKNIGFVSPEMFRSYQRNIAVRDIVASGLFDTNGLFKHPKPHDYIQVAEWMNVFGINQWSDRSYLQLSSGEQRLVLLCRAFVKNPPLLILDEPFHGLDNNYRHKAKQIIESYCKFPGHTLLMVSHYDEDFPTTINHILQLSKIE